MSFAAKILHVHVMHEEVVLRGHGTDAIEDGLTAHCAWNGMDDHVSIRQNGAHRRRYIMAHLLGTLECDQARHAETHVGKMAVARPADAYPIDIRNAFDILDTRNDVGARASGCGIKKRINGLPRQARADID